MKLRDIFIITTIILFFVMMLMFSFFKGCEANYTDNVKVNSESEKYYSKYDIKLKGIIVNKLEIDSRYCTYTIKVIDSNIKEHDLREFSYDYYLVIKNDSAKMVDGTYLAQVRDSIMIDYSKRISVVWNERRRIETPLLTVSPTYRIIRKQGLGY